MSAFCCTPSPNDIVTAKMKDPWQHTEEDWSLILEAELDPVQKQDEEQREAEERKVCKEVVKKAQEEAERKAEEACRVQEEAEKKEKEEREAAVQRAREAAEGPQRQAVGGEHSKGSGMQDPCARCHSKRACCVLGMAKGKMMACEVCCHVKANCSWSKKMVGEICKWKRVQQLEEVEEKGDTEVGEGEEEEVHLHFVVPPHLTEDHQDALGALTMMLGHLVHGPPCLLANDLKEEEMGKGKGREKEENQEGEPRRRMEDDDRDMEMGGVGPLSVV
ncbi:hypothetical protein ID866_6301 [Astraeus odoratus]|nr:hypothetical protein ID866_6301 [Astraeus odoratus]